MNLPTCLDINAGCDNEPCEFCHDHKCTFHCSQWKYNPSGYQQPVVLDELCNIDLTRYVWGEVMSDEVGKCRGTTCNYCGRYTEELQELK
jgi:hypothetical protein